MKLKTKLKILWYRLWIRKDEFHHSLNTKPDLMMDITRDERQQYMENLLIRRCIAHKKDLEKSNKN